jgi:hypothetical protein
MAVSAAPAPAPNLRLVVDDGLRIQDEILGASTGSTADHTRLVEMFEEAEDASASNREKVERDVDYRDGKQWTEAQVEKLRKRGQPAITHPLIREKINYLLGLERAQRTDPRALPRNPNPQDEGAAEAATDSLRFVCQQQRYDQSRSRCWEDILVAGWGGIEIGVKLAEGRPPEITLKRCAWDRMFYDPYSSEFDFSDANYLGMVRWMDRDEAIAEYGDGADRVFDESFQGFGAGDTYEDKPKSSYWVSWGKRKRIRVVLMYYKAPSGVWNFAEFTRGGFLRQGESPFLDDDGVPEHPYVWRSGYVDRENNRSGMVRDLIDLQDAINKFHSKAVHTINARQTFGNRKLPDVNTLRREINRPDGHIALEGDAEFMKDFGVIPTGEMSAGNLQLMDRALGAFTLFGPNAAMQGKGSQSASGRSIQANQQGGAIQMGALADTLNDMDFEVYRKVWRRVRQFWNAEMWVRVTDDEQKPRWVGLNQPIVDEMGYPAIDPATGMPQVRNAVAEMDVDIIVDTTPHQASLHGEQFGKLVELAPVVPMPPKVYLEASDLRNKGKLIQLHDEWMASQQPQPPQEPAPDPMAQQAQIAALQVELENKQADTANKQASAKSAAQAQEIAMRAELQRLYAAMGQPPR